MAQCKFTDSSRRDLVDIVEYTIKNWGKEQAIKYLDEIYDKTTMLSKNPKIGVLRNDIYPLLLSFSIRKHIIYYLQQPDGIVVIRILHNQMCPKLHSFAMTY